MLQNLLTLACDLGATAAAVIATSDIIIDDDLASLCREPGCENYGLAASCPPHVGGPALFRKLLEDAAKAIVFKIDVPTAILLSSERREVFCLLHEIAAGVETAAKKMGYSGAAAFAGGSCKRLFCEDHPECRTIGSSRRECRYPDLARPSMSGFGINVAELMNTAGWTMTVATPSASPDDGSSAPVCGLVLIA